MSKFLTFCLSLLFAASLQAVELPSTYGPTTFTAANDVVTITGAARQGFSVDARSITGTVAIVVEACSLLTCTSTDWSKLYIKNVSSGASSLTITANGMYSGSAPGGTRSLRVRAATLAAGQGVARIYLSWGDADTDTVWLAAVAGSVLGSLTSTAQGYSNVSRTSIALDSVTAYSRALSTLAGTTAGPLMIYPCLPIQGTSANVMRVAITGSSTAPTDLSTTGMPVYAGDTCNPIKPESFSGAQGQYLHMIVPSIALPTTASAQVSVDKWNF